MSQGATTGFIGLSGQANVLATDADAAGTIPMGGTITALYAAADSFGVVDGGSVTVTVFINGSASTLTCVLSAGTVGNATCNMTGASLSVSAGSTISLQVANNTSPNRFVRDIRWSAALAGS
jgi:hypothetical protein